MGFRRKLKRKTCFEMGENETASKSVGWTKTVLRGKFIKLKKSSQYNYLYF
jgi:hypothetical protein